MTDDAGALGAPTRDTVERVARGYGATVSAMHGDDDGLAVTFPTLHAATSFADTVAADWSVDLYTTVTDLWGTVTLAVRAFALPEVTVTWSANGDRQRYESRCALIDGYSTRADIPKMLAIKRGVDVRAIEIHFIDGKRT